MPPPRDQETTLTHRYNENDGVSTRMRDSELAFGIVICFCSTEFLHIYAILHMPRSTRRRHYMHQHLQPLSSSLLLRPSTCKRSPTFWSLCLRVRLRFCLRAARSVSPVPGLLGPLHQPTNPRRSPSSTRWTRRARGCSRLHWSRPPLIMPPRPHPLESALSHWWPTA